MNPSSHHRLLDDVLLSAALAGTLAATRRAARRRRVGRHTFRASLLAGIALAAAWVLHQPGEIVGESPIVKTTPTPAFILVTTTSANISAIVRTGTVPASLIVSTRNMTGPTPRASEDDLFALAGSRPAALHRLPDGSARWMWLDQKQPF